MEDMLSVSEMSRITKEVILRLPPTLTSKEALAFRAEVADDLAEMERQGIVPDLPYDFDMPDDPPADPPEEASAPSGELNPNATSLAEIRRSLTLDERLWLGQMIEAHGEAEVIRMWPSLIVQLEFSRSL
jgi:hypothetical protein